MCSKQMRVFLIVCVVSLTSCAAYKMYVPSDKLHYYPGLRTELSNQDFPFRLIDKLFDVGQSSLNVYSKFHNYIDEQVGKAMARVAETLEKFKIQVSDAISAVVNNLPGAQTVQACIAEKESKADVIFSNAVNKCQECIDNRRQKALELFNHVINITDNAQQYASLSKEEAKKCTDESNFLKIGACFTKLTSKVAKFVAKSKHWLGRMNTFMLMLPARLSFCAVTGLSNAGSDTARIVFEIGLCTSSMIHDYLTDYPEPSDNDSVHFFVPMKVTTDARPSTANQLDGNMALPGNSSVSRVLFKRKLI